MKDRFSFGRFFNSLAARTLSARASDSDAKRAVALCHALLSERGEVSGSRLAGEVLGAYQQFSDASQTAFFDLLAEEFTADPGAIQRAAEVYRLDPSPVNLLRLQAAVESPRQELFRRLNVASNGTTTLVQMRGRLLRDRDAHPDWLGIDTDLAHLFKSWFNRGFLELRRIDWRTSALVLEKLIQYEAVHEIQGWPDLRRRLQADRRCYAFFHHALPDEPIMFIEVALSRGLSAEVQALLDPTSAVLNSRTADAAIFYSITNCQEGLRGVSFGNLLIKQVVEEIGRELPRIRTYATLSPIPGFRRWLSETAALPDTPRRADLQRLLAKIDANDWWKDGAAAADVSAELLPLCAHYLLRANKGRSPLDSVARFHLGNGARLEQLNWLGDRSDTGMRRSAGVTANYVYRLADVPKNHEAYKREFKIAASAKLERLAAESLLSREAPAARAKTSTVRGEALKP